MLFCRGGIWRQHPQSCQDAALIELACAKVKDDEDEEDHYSIMIRKLSVRTLNLSPEKQIKKLFHVFTKYVGALYRLRI